RSQTVIFGGCGDSSGCPSNETWTLGPVQSAANQVSNLVSAVQSLNIAQGIANSLDAKLQAVAAALTAAQSGNVGATCNMLDAFINETQAQSGKAITLDEASQLLFSAGRIKAVIGC